GKLTPLLRKLQPYMPVVTTASGVLTIGIGVLVYYNLVQKLNQYFNFLPYVNFS
ncbi:MAG: hypothetical protein HW397_217, partial [Dehalococcoidia bacterium]|nr:hypothetical protein [Dehalococcoidia bacterium]